MAAEPDFAERARVGRVLDADGKFRRRFEHLPQIHVTPSEVRRENEPSGRIDAAGQADTDTFAHHARMLGPQAGDGPRHQPHEDRWIGGRRKRPLGFEPRIDVGQPDGRRLRPKVHANDAGALDVEVQKSRPPAPRQPADGAFGDPSFLDQLIDDGRDGATLQARAARQIRPRHRLMMPEEIERNPPVDLARGLTRGDLEVRQIDLAHGVGGTVSESTVDSRRSSVSVFSPSRQSQSAIPVGSSSRVGSAFTPVALTSTCVEPGVSLGETIMATTIGRFSLWSALAIITIVVVAVVIALAT